MSKPVDLDRTRAAQAGLDALRETFPELTSPEARERLSDAFPNALEDPIMPVEESITVRGQKGTKDRAAALVPYLQALWPSARVTQSTVLREALRRGLEALEREAKEQP